MGACLSSEKPATSDKAQSSASRVPTTAASGAQPSSETKNGRLKNNSPTSNNNNGDAVDPIHPSSGLNGSHEAERGNYSMAAGSSSPGTDTARYPNNNTSQSPNVNGNNNTDTANSASPNTNNNSSDGSTTNSMTQNGFSFANNSAPDTNNRPEVKIMLMGSGESGKSTILKQMKIIHQNGYSQDDLLMYKTTVYKNLLDCAKIIVDALEQFGIDITSSSNLLNSSPAENSSGSDATVVNITNNETKTISDSTENSQNTEVPKSQTALTTSDTANVDSPYISKQDLELIKHSVISADLDSTFDPNLTTIIIKLWAHPSVKEMYRTRRSQFYIMDSASYFFNNVQRIGEIDYIPSVPDILRARIKTTGIYDTRFQMGRLNIHMYDVGGQRSERKKWIHCFDDVTIIIFCVALSEYDQVLLEETSQNRMAESLVLFDSIISSRWFVRTSIILFLNKIDVFTEKLETSPLENYFSDYAGGPVVKKAVKYILWRFTKRNPNNLNIYPHITQATDTSNIRLVFAAVKETILQNSLRDSGLL